MSDNTIATEQLKLLKQMLDASIESKTSLEQTHSAQSTTLLSFIGKLSQACKGIDLELDNKLANFRVLLTKTITPSEIEQHIATISTLLKKTAVKNDNNINALHVQFLDGVTNLQKSNGLPETLRRNLRKLLKQNEQTKESIVAYLPVLSQLLQFYDAALKAKTITAQNDSTCASNAAITTSDRQADHEIIIKFSSILSSLVLSERQDPELSAIKRKLTDDISNNALIDCFLQTFDLITSNLKIERDTAEYFLSTLSETLATVQTAVKSTLLSNSQSQEELNKLNARLQQQISSMTSAVERANTLTDIKEDIHDKLLDIAQTIEQKNALQQRDQQYLSARLQEMSTKMSALEEQSKEFENRLHEQHIKSMQDALTKLANRAAFDAHFAKEIVRYHQKPFELAIVVLDLDNFKSINDNYGHAAGDKTLQVIAKTMVAQLPKEVFVGRYGGEEFVLVFANANKAQLLHCLDGVRRAVAALPFKFKNQRVSITVSIGATHIAQEDNVHIAFERADTALYQAKDQGRNCIIYLKS